MSQTEYFRVVLIGKPGCGKGSICTELKDEFDINHLSTGDLLRAQMHKDELFSESDKIKISSGELLKDTTILKVMKSAFTSNKKGFILDGFPLTIFQAKCLDVILKERKEPLTRVIELQVDDSILEKRICGRRVHASSGRIYHVDSKPPKIEGKDDITGEPLLQRTDDTPEALKKKLQEYYTQTQPVIDYYKSKGILISVNACAGVKQVIWNVKKAILASSYKVDHVNKTEEQYQMKVEENNAFKSGAENKVHVTVRTKHEILDKIDNIVLIEEMERRNSVTKIKRNIGNHSVEFQYDNSSELNCSKRTSQHEYKPGPNESGNFHKYWNMKWHPEIAEYSFFQVISTDFAGGAGNAPLPGDPLKMSQNTDETLDIIEQSENCEINEKLLEEKDLEKSIENKGIAVNSGDQSDICNQTHARQQTENEMAEDRTVRNTLQYMVKSVDSVTLFVGILFYVVVLSKKLFDSIF